MAQDITLMGASYSAVPAVLLPKTGGGTARFDDTTDADAAAADILAGKTAYVNGVKLIGTGSGVGAAVPLALRPDAELVKTWSHDQMLVADEGISLPAYTTASTTLKASANLSDTATLDLASYDYFVTAMYLLYPIYSADTKAKGREEYFMAASAYEVMNTSLRPRVSSTGSVTLKTVTQTGQLVRMVYFTNATALGGYASTSYGLAQAMQTPGLSTSGNTGTLTVKSPSITMRGHATYLSESMWNLITDVRNQYKIQLWRVPHETPLGWYIMNQFEHISDALDSDGTI